MKFISERLIGARKAKGLAQAELADAIEVSLRTIQNWEAGIFEPQGKNLRNLCEVLGVSINYLFGQNESKAHEITETDVPYSGSKTSQDIITDCIKYLGRVLISCHDNPRRLGWVYIELQKHFPLPNSSAGVVAEELLDVAAAEAEHADQASQRSPGVGAPTSQTETPVSYGAKRSKEKPAAAKQAPK